MKNTILYKRSNQIGKVPTANDLQSGELAINTADGALYLNNATISTPVGTIQAGYLNYDTNWILCDGKKYLKLQYPSLSNFLEYELFINNNIINPTDPIAVQSAASSPTAICVGTYSSLIYRSTDGINWNNIIHPIGGRWSTMIWTGSLFFTGSASGNSYMTSPDGINWTAGTIPGVTSIWAIAWNGTIFCISGNNTNIANISTNGVNWTPITISLTSRFYRTAISLGSLILLFSDGGNQYVGSIDGINWIAYTLPSTLVASNTGIYPVVFNNTIYISGTRGSAKSTDGINWTMINNFNGRFICPASKSMIYFISNLSEVFYSKDGNNWKTLGYISGYAGGVPAAFDNILYTGALFTLNANTDYFSVPLLSYDNSQPRYIKT
jgi:hypothetical protein